MKNYDNTDNNGKSVEKEFAERIEGLGYSKAYDELIALVSAAEKTRSIGDPSAFAAFMEESMLSSFVKGNVKELIQIVFGKTIEQVSEILTKEIPRLNVSRTIDTLISIDQKLRSVAISMHRVDLDRILIPVIRSISIEDYSIKRNMYVNLLTSAIGGQRVKAIDINTLQLLELNELLILDTLFDDDHDSCKGELIQDRSSVTIDEFKISVDMLIAQGIVESTALLEAMHSLQIFDSQDNSRILDLELIQKSFQNIFQAIVDAQTIGKYKSIQFSSRGREFIRKCKGLSIV